MDKELDDVIKICVSHFNLYEPDLYSSTRVGNVVLAKHLLWYILHIHYGYSINTISKCFFRTKRQVFNAIRKIRLGIDSQKFYKEIYNNLMFDVKNLKK